MTIAGVCACSNQKR